LHFAALAGGDQDIFGHIGCLAVQL
jgi:hypothetical protein